MPTRRQFLLRGGALVAAGAAASVTGPTVLVRSARAADKTLRILQWSHFVPAYDKWFDPWAKAWGQSKGIEVTVDHDPRRGQDPGGARRPLQRGEGVELITREDSREWS